MIALDERQAAPLRGPRADPAAHLLLRPYLKRAVYVASPTRRAGEVMPYWLMAHPAPGAAATADGERRHPAELAAAVESARHGSRQSGGWQSVG